jgi:hypothetical protein
MAIYDFLASLFCKIPRAEFKCLVCFRRSLEGFLEPNGDLRFGGEPFWADSSSRIAIEGLLASLFWRTPRAKWRFMIWWRACLVRFFEQNSYLRFAFEHLWQDSSSQIAIYDLVASLFRLTLRAEWRFRVGWRVSLGGLLEPNGDLCFGGEPFWYTPRAK